MAPRRRRAVGALLGAGAVFGVSAPGMWPLRANAQTWPARPLRLVIPFPAAGATDIQGRLFGQKLAAALGQQVVVENRPGAGGTIGADSVAKAAPDGYTILLATSSTHSIGPVVNARLPYDAFRDFAPIVQVSSSPAVLVVGETFPARTARDLVDLLKRNPGKYNFGSSGVGTNPHLVAELFKAQAGNLFAVHIPYKGTQLVIPDLISGEIAFLMDNIVSAVPHVKSGKLRALGVTAAARSAALPDVPTLAEAGITGMDVPTWFGFFAPAGTPASIVERLNAELRKILQDADTRERLERLGADPAGGTPASFAQTIRSEHDQWKRVIARAGIKPE